MVPQALTPGRRFPDLELPDTAGNRRCLSELVGGDPCLLTFYRGWWCPKEQAFFRALSQLQDEAEVAYTRFVSVSVDPPEVAAAFRAGLGARWTFLSDAERRFLRELDLAETTDPGSDPYAPTAFTLRPDLVVHGAYDGYWFWGRPTAEELRRDFREISRAVRPDWERPRRWAGCGSASPTSARPTPRPPPRCTTRPGGASGCSPPGSPTPSPASAA